MRTGGWTSKYAGSTRFPIGTAKRHGLYPVHVARRDDQRGSSSRHEWERGVSDVGSSHHACNKIDIRGARRRGRQ